MAKKKDDDSNNKILWIAGTACITAFAMYYVNKHLNEREELQRLKWAERQEKLKAAEE